MKKQRRKVSRVIFLKRRYLALAGALAAAACIFGAVSLPTAVETAAATRQLPIYCVDCGDTRRCSLSFDAAWGDVRVRHTGSSAAAEGSRMQQQFLFSAAVSIY